MKFESYHPVINFLYFIFAAMCVFAFDHPVYVCGSYVAIFLYSAKLGGRGGLIFNLCLIPLLFMYAALHACYNHFGKTVLFYNVIGNEITAEAVAHGLKGGFSAAAFVMLMSCMFKVISSDKVVYIFGRISPRTSLFISIVLRVIPRIAERGRAIAVAQGSIGMSPLQGNIPGRMAKGIRLLSITITWFLENLGDIASSMRSRGYPSKKRSAFSMYRFDDRDRLLLIFMSFCMIATAAGAMLDQAEIYYDPVIVMNAITPATLLFYAAYVIFMLIPLLLEIMGEYRFHRETGALTEM